jgi:hypothetical protein
MPFITQGKTNWKFLIIVIILAIIVGGGALWYAKRPEKPYQPSEIKEPERVTEEKCNDIQDLAEQTKCYTNLAKKTTDESYCEKIEIPEAPEVKANCYVELAILKNNPSICWKVETASLASSCWEYFGMRDWKTYKNEEYGFEFKYPQNWGLEILSNVSNPYNEGIDIIQPYNNVYKPGSFVGKDLKFLIVLSSSINLNNIIEDNKAGEINLGNVMAWHYKRQIPGPETMVLTEEVNLIPYKDFYIEISELANYGSEDYNFRSRTIGTILSTFRFIEADSRINYNFIYLTDNIYDGNLGGRLGADSKCVSPLGLTCKKESIHAFITVDATDSIINMADNYNLDKTLPIYWYNKETKKGFILANDWSSMFDKNIINSQLEGTGQNDWVWTGGRGDEKYLETCEKWKTNEGGSQTWVGPRGTFGGTETDKCCWLSASGWAGISAIKICVSKKHLFCICEGSI